MGGQYSWTSGCLWIWRTWGKIQPVVNWILILNNTWNSFSITVLMEFSFAKLKNEITEIMLGYRQFWWQATELLLSCSFTSWDKKFNSVLLLAFISTQVLQKSCSQMELEGTTEEAGYAVVHTVTLPVYSSPQHVHVFFVQFSLFPNYSAFITQSLNWKYMRWK